MQGNNPAGVQVTGGFQAAVLTSSPAAAPLPNQAPMTIAGNTQANYLVPVLPSGEDPSYAFELPAGHFNFMIGRTDIGNGIVPQMAVEDKWPLDFIKQRDSWLFSRKTAYVRRDEATSQMFIRVDPDCGVTVLIASPASSDFRKIIAGDEVLLEVGSTLIFGYKGHGARAVVR
jgi:hypothetical protein